jgi:hypothetical protein
MIMTLSSSCSGVGGLACSLPFNGRGSSDSRMVLALAWLITAARGCVREGGGDDICSCSSSGGLCGDCCCGGCSAGRSGGDMGGSKGIGCCGSGVVVLAVVGVSTSMAVSWLGAGCVAISTNNLCTRTSIHEAGTRNINIICWHHDMMFNL